MKLRPVPIVMAVLISSVVLFGGWFAYRSYALENPLQQKLQQLDQVEAVELDWKKQQLIIRMELADDASMREIVQEMTKAAESYKGKRELQFIVTNEQSAALDQWWSQQLFAVAQAMEARKYAEIPLILSAASEQTADEIQVFTEIDEKQVYIRLNDERNSKFIQLPRTPVMLGAWSDE